LATRSIAARIARIVAAHSSTTSSCRASLFIAYFEGRPNGAARESSSGQSPRESFCQSALANELAYAHPGKIGSSRSRTRSDAVSRISNREAARSLSREVNDMVFSLREACAVAFRMSHDETSVARSIVGDGLDETWRSHVYGQPHPVPLCQHIARYNSQLIRETTSRKITLRTEIVAIIFCYAQYA